MSAEFCPECGAKVPGGGAGCHALWEAFSFEALENVRLASVQTLAFDTYCMQHVETYGVSAKSYIAHLTRLCVGIEFDGKLELYAALQKWYHSGLTKPDILHQRGTIYLVDVQEIPDKEAKISKIHEWARNVWQAYSSQHDLARAWVQEAMNQRK